MTTIDVKNTSGKKAGSAELAASVFEIEPNMHAMHEVVRSQRAARRARHAQHAYARSGSRWR